MKKIQTIIKMFVVALISFYTYTATAQQQERGGEKKSPTFDQLIEEMYANEDGYISKEEFENIPKPERKGRPSNNK